MWLLEISNWILTVLQWFYWTVQSKRSRPENCWDQMSLGEHWHGTMPFLAPHSGLETSISTIYIITVVLKTCMFLFSYFSHWRQIASVYSVSKNNVTSWIQDRAQSTADSEGALNIPLYRFLRLLSTLKRMKNSN